MIFSAILHYHNLRRENERLRQDRRFLIERCLDLRDIDAKAHGIGRFRAQIEETDYIERNLAR